MVQASVDCTRRFADLTEADHRCQGMPWGQWTLSLQPGLSSGLVVVALAGGSSACGHA
jgi:hypothetical protein